MSICREYNFYGTHFDFNDFAHFYCFPINIVKRTPAIHDWHKLATNNMDKFKKGFTSNDAQWRQYHVVPDANKHRIGIVTKYPLVIIDIDQNHKDEADEFTAQYILDRLYNEYKIPQTLTIRTKRGGYHLYYYTDLPEHELKNFSISTFKKLFKQIDFKVGNSYVLTPDRAGSDYRIHIKGKIASLPSDFLLKFAKQKKEYLPCAVLSENSSQYEAYIEAVARQSIAKVLQAVDGNINNTLFEAAAALGNFLHYGFYTEGDIVASLSDAIATRGKGWADWAAYRKNADATIASGISTGMALPKYIENKSMAIFPKDYNAINKAQFNNLYKLFYKK